MYFQSEVCYWFDEVKRTLIASKQVSFSSFFTLYLQNRFDVKSNPILLQGEYLLILKEYLLWGAFTLHSSAQFQI